MININNLKKKHQDHLIKNEFSICEGGRRGVGVGVVK